jgi:hypothetical protein
MKKIGGPFFVFFFFFSVYLVSLAPSVWWWDSGELAANVQTLGVPHRPGFPLYVFLARVFTFLPIGNFVFELNLFSGLCAAMALTFFHLSLAMFLGRLGDLLGGSEARRNLVAFLVTLTIGFTFSFWIQAVRAEVYGLGALLFTFATYCFLRATPNTPHPQSLSTGGEGILEKPSIISVGNSHTARWFWLGILVSFLGLGNHHVTMLSTFPFLTLVAGLSTFATLSFKKWMGVFFLFLLGISTYLYLPVRSLAQPFFNWGGPDDFASTANLVLATDSYRFISWSAGELGLKMFEMLSMLHDQMGLGLFGIAFGGLLILLFAKRSWFNRIALLILANLFVSAVLAAEVYRDNPDLHGYLIYSLFGLGFGLAAGIGAFFGTVERAVGAVSNFLVGFARVGLAVLFLFMAMLPWTFSRPLCDLSENRIPLKMAQEALAPVPPGGVVFLDSRNMDFVIRGVQYGERWRQDIAVVNRAFLETEWYRKGLVRNFPRLAEVFESAPKKVDADLLFKRWAFKFADKNVPVFVEFTERDKNLVDYLTPAGFLFQFRDSVITLDTVALEQQLIGELSGLWSEDDRVMKSDPQAVKMLVLYLYRSGLYYEWRGAKKKALNFYNKAVVWGERGEELQKRILHLEKERTLAERKTSAPFSMSETGSKKPGRKASR